MYALRRSRAEIASILMESGHDVNQVSSVDGSTPLVVALSKQMNAACMQLLHLGADPNVARPGDGQQPLMIAFQTGMFDVVQLLISRDDVVLTNPGVDVNPNLFDTMNPQLRECLSKCPPMLFGQGLRGKQLWLSCNLAVLVRQGGDDVTGLALVVRRNSMLEGLCAQFGIDEITGEVQEAAQPQHLFVSFHGENAGGDGLRREWLNKATAEIVDSERGLFLSKDGGRTLQPNPESKLVGGDDHLSYFALLGRMAGTASITEPKH